MKKEKMREIRELAERINENVDDKSISYCIKIFINALTYKNESAFCEILLELCSLANVELLCMSDLFEDFESNATQARLFTFELLNIVNTNRNQ